ncbi:MAG: HisS family protein [Dehalococcoidia bacterium]|nr:HisS family protein [Dehalococcoidia bacterium]
MKIPKCKGASDWMPQDMRQFRHIEEVFRKSCSGWGYNEIRTPSLEYLQLFTSAGTLSPEMLGRLYSFLDWDGWSGERVVLRPDGTIPTARLYVEQMADMPLARLCYIENMFSFEGSGQEARERWQCGVELMGSAEPEGDAELILLALEILSKLDITPITIKLSHVGLFRTLLKELGLPPEEQEQRLLEILTGDIRALGKIKGESPEVNRFLKLLLDLQGTSHGFLENLRSVLPEKLAAVKPYIDSLAGTASLLDSIGQSYEVNFASGEGFEYYTGMVFQFYGRGELVGKGGRYDELVPLVGGGNVPASGFALFIDKLICLIPQLSGSSPKILVKQESGRVEEMKAAFEIARLLRGKGYAVEMGKSAASDCTWIISSARDGKSFTLVNASTEKDQKGLSFDQLLQRLGESKEC